MCSSDLAAKNDWNRSTQKSNKRIIGWHPEDWDEPPIPDSPVLMGTPADEPEVEEITENDPDPMGNSEHVTLERAHEALENLPPCIQISNATGMRRSRRDTRQTTFFDPATNLNDTAIRAARAANNPLYAPQLEADLPDLEDLGDPVHSVLNVTPLTRIQHPGVAKELAAWRESMTIKQAKYQCRHFNPHSYSFATFASGGCLDSLGAIKVGLNPLFANEVVPAQRRLWEDLTKIGRAHV